jgi:hypothetical protein
MKRREFLGYLMAGASTCVLAACGGGAPDMTFASNGNDDAAQPPTATTTSPNGTISPPAPSIVDLVGNEWKVSSAQIYKNGVKDSEAYNVALLLFYNRSIYHKDTTGSFFQWTGSNWEKCDDPQVADASSTDDAAKA